MVPSGYKDYLICKEMRWTYQELQSTPAEIVDDFWVYMQTEWTVQNEQSESMNADMQARSKGKTRR
jgi:hypothetical protein